VEAEPILVLDVRDAVVYAKCHLVHSVSYPLALLQRDKVSAQLYAFKSAGEEKRKYICYLYLICIYYLSLLSFSFVIFGSTESRSGEEGIYRR
jgi:hypothetical protein